MSTLNSLSLVLLQITNPTSLCTAQEAGVLVEIHDFFFEGKGLISNLIFIDRACSFFSV